MKTVDFSGGGVAYIYIHICFRATGFNLIKLAKPPSKYISLFSGEANVHVHCPLLSNTFTLFFLMLLSASGYETEWSPTVTGLKVGIFVCLLCWVMGLVPMFIACDDWILPEAHAMLVNMSQTSCFLNLLTEQGLKVVVSMEHS